MILPDEAVTPGSLIELDRITVRVMMETAQDDSVLALKLTKV
jgi:hypothetical protein